MSVKLEASINKLVRLESELKQAQQSAYSHMLQANGQPMNDKRGGSTFFKTRDRLENRIFSKMHEIEEQKERIERMKEQIFNRENYLTANGGVSTCVQNIDVLKERKQTADVRRKIAMLETMQRKSQQDSQQLSENAKQLIEIGAVKLWDKQPIYYFVKDLKKVAFVVDKNGNFVLSKKYPAKNAVEQRIADELLQMNQTVTEIN